MILLVALALVVASAALCGGRLSNVAHLEIRYGWLATAACVFQTLLISVVPQVGQTTGNLLHLSTYAMAGGFLLANLHLPGIKWLGLGAGMNLAAIVANGGVMPASAWATRVAGLSVHAGEFANSRAVEHPRLLVFGDIMAIPHGWPLANVFSIGDVLLVIGAGVLVHVGSGSRLVGAGLIAPAPTETPSPTGSVATQR